MSGLKPGPISGAKQKVRSKDKRSGAKTKAQEQSKRSGAKEKADSLRE
jgi:hypothetical protein